MTVDITIDVGIPTEGLYTCEAIMALLQDMIADRRDLELGERGVFGLFLLLEAQRRALTDIGAAIAAEKTKG